MRERYGFAEGLCPVAEAKSTRTLALPFHARLAADDQAFVADTLRQRARLDEPGRGGQGEALVALGRLGGLGVTLVLVVTYSRIDPWTSSTTSTVTGSPRARPRRRPHELARSPSLRSCSCCRDATSLPRAAWWVAGPSIALCATIATVRRARRT